MQILHHEWNGATADRRRVSLSRLYINFFLQLLGLPGGFLGWMDGCMDVIKIHSWTSIGFPRDAMQSCTSHAIIYQAPTSTTTIALTITPTTATNTTLDDAKRHILDGILRCHAIISSFLSWSFPRSHRVWGVCLCVST